MLGEQGLTRYYTLRDGPGMPVGAGDPGDTRWVERLEAEIPDARGVVQVNVDLQGIRCAACVWLLQEVYRKRKGSVAIEINPGAGKARLAFRKENLIAGYVADAAAFGYRMGPSLKRASSPGAAGAAHSLRRLGRHRDERDAPLARALPAVRRPAVRGDGVGGAWALGLAAVIVGGTPFFRSAWQAARRGVAHLDIPIALGIALAFGGSTYSFFRLQGRASYFDTVATFIALMLLGRLLQERVVEKNRRSLLADRHLGNARPLRRQRADAPRPRRRDPAGRPPAPRARRSRPRRRDGRGRRDRVAPVALGGEAEPVAVAKGGVLTAGSFVAGTRAVPAVASARSPTRRCRSSCPSRRRGPRIARGPRASGRPSRATT